MTRVEEERLRYAPWGQFEARVQVQVNSQTQVSWMS